MTTAEKDYTAVEHMVMALMFAIGKFKPYLLPKKFVILTLEENFPLVLQHMDVSARISKWLVRLQEFEYTAQVENSTRASLAGLLTHRCYEKKLKVKPTMVKVEEEVSKLGEAHLLYFDGAYKRKVDKAAVGVVIYDEEGRKVFGKGLMLENVHSKNEAEYAALSLGLEWCLNLGIKRLNAFGDALLLVKQVHGTWAYKNQGLVVQLCRVKELLKRFEVAHLLHVPRKDNQEADTLAKVEPDAKGEIVGGYNCEEQDPKVELHVEKEGVLEKDSLDNEDQAKNCPSSMKDNEVLARDTGPSILQTIQMMQRERKRRMTSVNSGFVFS
ncbi:hypothetical protein L7F22_013254 [Adiantum nelumboides]|nr:hypothetical protein [Adiantum nelumboides]